MRQWGANSWRSAAPAVQQEGVQGRGHGALSASLELISVISNECPAADK